VSPTVVVDGVGFVEFAVPSVGVYTNLNCSLEMELRIEVVRFHLTVITINCYRRSRSVMYVISDRGPSHSCCYSLTYIVGC
jgi:hypothetical protein